MNLLVLLQVFTPLLNQSTNIVWQQVWQDMVLNGLNLLKAANRLSTPVAA